MSKGPCRPLGFNELRFNSWTSRIKQDCDQGGRRHQCAQEFQAFCRQFCRNIDGSGGIAPWAVQAGHKPGFDWTSTAREYNRNRRGRSLGGTCRCKAAGGHDHCGALGNQIGDEPRKPVVLSFGPTVVDRNGPAFDVAQFAEASTERGSKMGKPGGGCVGEITDYRHRLRLRARRDRPRRRSASEQLDELAPLHSITSSAWARSGSGTLRPSVFATLRFTTKSYLVGSWTGISPALTPLRMRST